MLSFATKRLGGEDGCGKPSKNFGWGSLDTGVLLIFSVFLLCFVLPSTYVRTQSSFVSWQSISSLGSLESNGSISEEIPRKLAEQDAKKPFKYLGICPHQCDEAVRFLTKPHVKGGAHLCVCAHFIGGEGFCLKPISDKYPKLMITEGPGASMYSKSAFLFLSDMADALPRGTNGTAVYAGGDSGDKFGDPVLDRLWDLKSPFMTHSTRSQNTNKFIFMPDYHFIEYRGFEKTLSMVKKHEIPFSEKKRTVFWRGSTTGLSDDCFEQKKNGVNRGTNACETLPRVRLVRAALNISSADAQLVGAVQCCAGYYDDLDRDGLIGNKAVQASWPHNRGIFDIGGNGAAWGLFWRLASGSVVFRVVDDDPWNNMYLNRSKPWVHYIPVNANLSDLESKTKLVTSTEPDVEEMLRTIVQNAKNLTSTFTYKSVVKDVSRQLREAWD